MTCMSLYHQVAHENMCISCSFALIRLSIFSQTGYAAVTAYHMTTEASLVALNEVLSSPVGMDRFRSNIVIGGTEPFAEVCINLTCS